tara:strand:- start:1065 stop:1607 length:543 start_codon:yes stop_codon:yes gene_type:complete
MALIVGGTTVTGTQTLDATKLTGTIADARIPSLAASKITSGAFATDRIPNFNATKITTGTLGTSQLPNFNASKITSGTMNGARVSGGTFGAVSASNLTSVPSSAPIFSAFDSLGASTCLAKINGGGNMSPSATLGGSNFGPATVQGGRFGNSVSGTWRVMGGGITDAATADRTTVMHRIS